MSGRGDDYYTISVEPPGNPTNRICRDCEMLAMVLEKILEAAVVRLYWEPKDTGMIRIRETARAAIDAYRGGK